MRRSTESPLDNHAAVLKRRLAEQIERRMKSAGLSKLRMARRMGASRSQLDRVLDPECVRIQLDTLVKAARAVGRNIEVSFHQSS